MESAQLLSYEVYDLARTKYVGALEDVPADQRYAPVTMAQIMKADREVFKIFSKACKGYIVKTGSGVYPLEPFWEKALDSQKVHQILAQLPKVPEPSRQDRKSEGNSDLSSVWKAISNLSSKFDSKGGGKGSGGKSAFGGKASSGKASSPGRPRSREDRLPRPRELVGLHIETEDREPTCFGFNLDGCNEVKGGEAKCKRGHHVCARCLKPGHSQRDRQRCE